MDQRIARNIYPEKPLAVRFKIEHRTHYRRQKEINRSRTVLARHRGDMNPRVAFRNQHGIPCIEGLSRSKAFIAKLAGGMFGCDDRKVFLQAFFDDLIKVVAVIMRKYTEVDMRQCLQIDRRIGKPLGGHSITQMNVVTRMKEIRIREDREPSAPKYHRRCSDEEYRSV